MDLLEAASILLAQKNFVTLLELSLAFLKYGRDYAQRQHLQPGYYQKWLQRRERYRRRQVERQIREFRHVPTISFVIVAGPGSDWWLSACLESLRRQWYPHWEAKLFGQGGDRPEILTTLQTLAAGSDPRIRSADESGAADLTEAMNRTLAMATGEFVVFLTGPILLTPTALFQVVEFLNREPQAEVIFGDEDEVDAAGWRHAPFFKPGWSPDLALALPYTGQLTLFRTSRVLASQGVRADMGPALGYDVLLRLLLRVGTDKIVHLPRILSHRLTAPPGHDPEATLLAEAMGRALSDHLRRIAQPGEVRAGEYPGTLRIIRDFRDDQGVSIIIPFKDNLPLLSQCLNSIRQKTDFPVWEIILVNNQSRERETYEYLEHLAGDPRICRLDYDRPFNYAAMNNLAAVQARHPFILCLNDDTEVISPDWLRALLEHIHRDEVGAVGGKLLYPDGAIQTGGLVVGGGGLLCGDFFRGLTAEEAARQVLTQVTRNCSAATGACLLTKKQLFQAVGGFDEVNFPICYNDVDYCLKLRERGYLIVWTPYATLYHHESASRGKNLKATDLDRLGREQQYFELKWAAVIRHDPYYNPNLSRIFDGYAY